jgi:hypothetical protein
MEVNQLPGGGKWTSENIANFHLFELNFRVVLSFVRSELPKIMWTSIFLCSKWTFRFSCLVMQQPSELLNSAKVNFTNLRKWTSKFRRMWTSHFLNSRKKFETSEFCECELPSLCRCELPDFLKSGEFYNFKNFVYVKHPSSVDVNYWVL